MRKVPQIGVLSLLWFFNLAVLGLLVPYFSVYLRQNVGLEEGRIGLVIAVLPGVALLAQPWWGWLSDRSGRRKWVLVGLCGGASISFLFLGKQSGFAALVVATGVVAFFYRSITPMLTGASMAVLQEKGSRAFGLARSFGTAGFLASVLVFPWILRIAGSGEDASGNASEVPLGLMFGAMAILSALNALVALALPHSEKLELRSTPGDHRRLLRHVPLRRLLVVLFLAFSLVIGPLNLLPLLVLERGGSLETIAWMWLIMLLVEVPMVARSGVIISRLGVRAVMILGFSVEGCRWLLSAWTTDLGWLLAVQGLHAFGVVALHVGAPVYLDAIVPARLRSTGQAWQSIAGMSAGAIVSNVAAGYLFQLAGPTILCLTSGLGTVALVVLIVCFLPQPQRPVEVSGSTGRKV